MKPLSQKDVISVVIDADSIDDNNPMKIRNAIRTERINDALAWAKSWQTYGLGHCQDCGFIKSLYTINAEHCCKDCLLNRAFGEVTR